MSISISNGASAAFRIEACVIGAGVVGLAAARALALAGKEVLILESENTFGSGTSSRNSEVIHAGIYYPNGSLKAQLCVKGNEMLYKFCNERNISCENKGKLLVATDESQLKMDIPRIMKHASGNGVKDLVMLSGHDVKSCFEPQVSCVGALLSPSTGIIDSHSLMLNFLADAQENGATLALMTRVDGIAFTSDDKIIVESEGMQIECDFVINCAGLYADKIAAMANVTKTRSSRQYFAKGNYYKLEGQKSPFHHLIYPVPAKGGLGVHATIDFMGSTRFGPDVEWLPVDVTNPNDIDLRVDPKRSESFYSEVRKYWPDLHDGALQPDYAGIRPKLRHPSVQDGPSTNTDFHIQMLPGIKGFVNLMGIESPGLTASMAIGEKIVEMLTEDGLP